MDTMSGDAGLFFALWLQRPLRIAAIHPSSIHLADAMARLADLTRSGPILELGAGTGSLTRGLLRNGCPPGRIIALEREPGLVTVLRRAFPGITVIEGDATRIDEYLRDGHIDRLAAVVSSLPIKWFPEAAQRAILEPCLERLGPDGRFLQLTNAFASPVARHRLGIAGREACRVWRNLPPAQVWSYAARADANV